MYLGAGWTDNKLRVKPSSSVSRVEVLGPGALSNAFGTVSRTVGGSVSTPPHPCFPPPSLALRLFTLPHYDRMTAV